MACIGNDKVDAQSAYNLHFEQLKGFPTTEKGIEKGVSACFAGIVNNYLVMAGGCNFPDIPVAEGGKKKYYRGIYAAKITDTDTLHWQWIGELPTDCAYGVSISLADGLLCLGGCNAEKSFNNVYKIALHNNKAVITTYPSMPWTMDNFAGTLGEEKVFVYNGKHIAQLALNNLEQGWQVLPSITSEKLGQPVCGYTDGAFCVWGGCTPKTETKDTELVLHGWRLTTKTTEGITKISTPHNDKQQDIYLGGAAAVNCGKQGILTLGGVNKDIFEAAVNRPQPGYMTHPKEWYQFNRYITLYNNNKWHILGKHEAAARAGAALAYDGTYIYIIGGELKPGIRTADIYRFRLPKP